MSEAWWQQATTIPDDDREIAKHYTLDRPDLDLIMRQNKASNRLGLACILATLHYPGRPQTRREHLVLFFDRMQIRPFAPSDVRALTGWLTPAAQTLRQADKLADMVVEELRRRRILLPTRSALEAIIHVAIRRGIRIAHRALASGLSESQKLVDKLLDAREGTSLTVLAWARTPALSPAAVNLDRIAERVRFLRSLNLSAALMERIPAKVFDEFAAEGMRMSAQHLRDLNPERRHAVLAAT
ncbi:DUF4158 domain-containing protein [Agrobacterium sp. LAD9]|uniref:DUF4158 domain-containing protein n=1 Tax=Agrobacterium sp. LAD9 TaxID=2055153 RepID=UPI0018641935|nr:DUF4158 domain-containing protein [Agrobacterium sp. LAD9]